MGKGALGVSCVSMRILGRRRLRRSVGTVTSPIQLVDYSLHHANHTMVVGVCSVG